MADGNPPLTSEAATTAILKPVEASPCCLSKLRGMKSAQAADSEGSTCKLSIAESAAAGAAHEAPARRPTRASIASLGLSMRFMRNLHAARPSMKEKPEKVLYLENTYRMEPGETNKFAAAKVRPLIEDVLTQYLHLKTYVADTGARWSCDLSNRVLNRVKKAGFLRYKFVAHVVIGSPTDINVNVASRCVWSDSIDNFASYTYKSDTIFAVATVYGVYFE